MNKELILRTISSIVLIPSVIFIIIKGSIIFNFFIISCFFIASLEWYKMSKKKLYSIIGFIFLLISFFCVYALRNNFNENGLIFFLFVSLVCVSTDIGGYCFGKIFKGPKLTKISPNKTYSGMIGSYLTPILLLFFYFYFNKIFPHNFQIQEINIQILIFLVLISSISQIGDIVISYFKRISKIKNTGSLIPGHGGLLDRIDGMIFAFPFSYIILLYFN